MVSLSELQQHTQHSCDNNWIRKIAFVQRVKRKRTKYLREEVESKYCVVGKIVSSRTKCAGHVVRTKAERLPKISETAKQEGCRDRERRPQLRWEDCLKRGLGKAEQVNQWREKANDRKQWKK